MNAFNSDLKKITDSYLSIVNNKLSVSKSFLKQDLTEIFKYCDNFDHIVNDGLGLLNSISKQMKDNND